MQFYSPLDPISALAWYHDMGVDLCVEDAPQVVRKDEVVVSRQSSVVSTVPQQARIADEMPEFDRAAPAPSPQPPAPSSSSVTQAITEARALADAAADLAALEAAIRGFEGCAIKKTAKNTVFAEGVASSGLMFIGEAPGAEEDRAGVPFCGPSGQLLDRMLGFIGLKRDTHFYITNTLFWRPPGNRQPTEEELAICRPFVEKHIALVAPKLLVLVGGTATKSILGDPRGITRLRGQVFRYQNDYMAADIPVHVIYHPSYLLRQPLAKKQCWADILALGAALRSSSP